MEEKVLVVNAGSSSLKFTLYAMPEEKEIVNGLIERIGDNDSSYTLKFYGKKIENKRDIKNHIIAAHIMLKELIQNKFINNINEIKCVGHRILHGGEKYFDSVRIDNEVIEDIKDLTKLGPLHHPGELDGIKALMEVLPNVVQVAVFDTSFHQTMTKENFMYAVPYSWYIENGVRKYGFHGTSHKYITEYMKKELNNEFVNLIICHIGSGASICCIKDGKSYDTSMGLTPLDGLMMGTRSGSIDASILEYMVKEKNISVEEVIRILNNQSGLKGICGKNDFRDVCDLANQGDEKAILAINMFKNSIEKYIGQYFIELKGDVDAIVFTAGIGENMSLLREEIINDLSKPLNIKLNKENNDNIAKFKQYQTGIITTDDSNVRVYVVPTNEESMILKDAYNIYKNNNNYSKIKRRNK